VGIHIWRVENFQVVKKPATDPSFKGTFFSGDSYVVILRHIRSHVRTTLQRS
jgi:hypothetical protein